MSLMLYSGVHDILCKHKEDIDFLKAIPSESLKVLMDSTSSVIQKKTAMKMLHRFVRQAGKTEAAC
jgi:hypothetical protein